jgi:hypothetical protein
MSVDKIVAELERLIAADAGPSHHRQAVAALITDWRKRGEALEMARDYVALATQWSEHAERDVETIDSAIGHGS